MCALQPKVHDDGIVLLKAVPLAPCITWLCFSSPCLCSDWHLSVQTKKNTILSHSSLMALFALSPPHPQPEDDGVSNWRIQTPRKTTSQRNSVTEPKGQEGSCKCNRKKEQTKRNDSNKKMRGRGGQTGRRNTCMNDMRCCLGRWFYASHFFLRSKVHSQARCDSPSSSMNLLFTL